MRIHVLVSVAITFLITFISSMTVLAESIDLTKGQWLVSATDTSNVSWDGTILEFTKQMPNGDDFSVEGQFDWIGSSGAFGRELFTGTFFSDLRLELQGFTLVPPTSGIIFGSYSADVTPNGDRIINGSWPGGIPGVWQAEFIPEPTTLTVLLGVSSIALFRRRVA